MTQWRCTGCYAKANQARYPVATACRLLGVSTSGFYAWLKRGPSQRTRQDARLTERIRAVHTRSRGTYGAPRIHHDPVGRDKGAELCDEGIQVGRKRVARPQPSTTVVDKCGIVWLRQGGEDTNDKRTC